MDWGECPIKFGIWGGMDLELDFGWNGSSVMGWAGIGAENRAREDL